MTSTQVAVAVAEPLSLALPELPELKRSMSLVPVPEAEAQVVPTLDPKLARAVDGFVERILAVKPDAVDAQRASRREVDSMGSELQKQAALRSKMLQQPIKKLAERGADGGPVANALVQLKMEVEELDPSKVDLSVSGFGRLLSAIPGVGTRLQRYFLRYESAQGLIDEIMSSLNAGKKMLENDNITLADDQDIMRKLTLVLADQVNVGIAIDARLSTHVAAMTDGEEQKRFLQEEILFPLKQRIMDLQQQLAVNQQGVIATEIVIRNNRELIRGVDRAINVTCSALTVAVAVALALANQKIVLDKIELLNTTTSNLIAGTAARLKTQGVAIHTQASNTMLNMESLQQAFADVVQAMDEISRYRVDALPRMAEQILLLDNLTNRGEVAIQRMEAGNRTRPSIEASLSAA